MAVVQTAFLIIALAIVVNDGGATVQKKSETDQLAEEAKSRLILDSPKYVNPPQKNQLPNGNYTIKLEPKPPSKPPIRPSPEIPTMPQTKKLELSQQYYNQLPRVLPQNPYPLSPHKLHAATNPMFRFPRVIPLPPGHHYYASASRPSLVFAASTGQPYQQPYVAKSPKFSLPSQTINGIRTDFVRPPKIFNITTTTTIAPTTTTRVLRTKRIWPKRILDKMNTNATVHNVTVTLNKTEANINTNSSDREASANTYVRIRNTYANLTDDDTKTTTAQTTTTRGYKRVTRVPKKKLTTQSPNFDVNLPNDWVPIIPTPYPIFKIKAINPTQNIQPRISKRADVIYPNPKTLVAAPRKQTLFVHSYGLLPMANPALSGTPTMQRKKMVFFKRKPQVNPYLYSAYSSGGLQAPSQLFVADLRAGSSHYQPRFVTKIKHHHHHHHHRYIKTVEKPVEVPVKVEVPKPYPVEKKVAVPVPIQTVKILERPYPVTVEKKIPYPVHIKVPQPIPVKVVEKEYVPKPYPIIHQIPIIKHVEVPKPYAVEKKVPYPVKVAIPVDRPIAVPVEKKVPYPVPVKVLVPQPYPVERKVPYPVEVKVKEPVEVIKHVPVRIPFPQPYPVKVPKPFPVVVEKKVPYPVEVEKKVAVPIEILVPQRVEVEKRIPVYVPKPYPVEKKVPYPIKVPYPVKVPVKVPIKVPVEVQVPVYIHHPFIYTDDKYISNEESDISRSATTSPQHTVTVHGNTGFTGFQSRSDKPASIETTSSTETP